MTKLQGTFKLRVKIGASEFEAEGQPDLVAQRFEEFRRLIGNPEWSSSETERTGGEPRIAEQRETAGPDTRQAAASPEELGSLIRYDRDTRRMSLAALPEGKYREADSVLLLLLGHKRFRGEDEVPVTVLKEGLKQSGCPVARLDRVLMTYTRDRLVLKSGLGKGGKYRLTNRGLKNAEAIARELSIREI